MERPTKTMKMTLGTTAIGATLLPTTLLTLSMVALAHNPYLLILVLVQPIIGLSMLISSAVMRYNSRMAMRQAAGSVLQGFRRGAAPQGNWYHPAPAYQQQYRQPAAPYRQPMQPISPPARSAAIPDSAFLRDFDASAIDAAAGTTNDHPASSADGRTPRRSSAARVET
jgi:hypothetical protein